MTSTFETVPKEILQDICGILDTVHPTSLVSFARASKHCYSVASTVLYRTVKVAITDQAPFQFLHVLETRLLRDHAFEHVRRLILCGEPGDWPYSSLQRCERAFEDDTGRMSCWGLFGCEQYQNETSIPEDEWEPIIRLVDRLPGLADFYWERYEQLPLRLLNVLDSKAKLCRLHHYTFHLGSPSETSLNPYERALITSPSLYSIGNMDWCTAALESARDIRSPNLRRVYLCVTNETIKQHEIDKHEHGKVRVPVLREVIQMDSRAIFPAPIPFSMVQAEAFGDFSALRVLILYESVETEHLPSASQFPSLDTLTYTCDVFQSVTPESWDELSTFLRNLPRLATLEISRWDRSVSFTAALNSNLRTLKLSTWDDSDGRRLQDDHIHALADRCPNLEHLQIEIPRSRGDAAEALCYQSLGRLGRLQELHINLVVPRTRISPDDWFEATSDTISEPWSDEPDAQYSE